MVDGKFNNSTSGSNPVLFSSLLRFYFPYIPVSKWEDSSAVLLSYSMSVQMINSFSNTMGTP